MRNFLGLALCFCHFFGAYAQTPTPSPTSSDPSTKSEKKDGFKRAKWSARLIRAEQDQQINILKFDQSEFPVTLIPKSGRLRPMVEVEGIVLEQGWTLWLKVPGSDLVPVRFQKDRFKFYAYLNGPMNEITLMTKNSKGEKKTEVLSLYAPEAQEFRITNETGEFLVSLGITQTNYFQGFTGYYTSKNILVMGAFRKNFQDSAWGVYAEGGITFLPFGVSVTGSVPQALMAKADATYLAYRAEADQWNIRALAGVSYLTMPANGSRFGFKHLIVGEYGAIASYRRENDSKIYSELRLLPLSGLTQITKGFDLRAGYSWYLANHHRLNLELALARNVFMPTTRVEVDTSQFALKIIYSL